MKRLEACTIISHESRRRYGDKKFKICELLPKAQSLLVKKRKIRSQQVARAQKKQRLEKRDKNLADLLKQVAELQKEVELSKKDMLEDSDNENSDFAPEHQNDQADIEIIDVSEGENEEMNDVHSPRGK